MIGTHSHGSVRRGARGPYRPNLLFEFRSSCDLLAKRYGPSVATTYFCLRRRGLPAHLCLLAAREHWKKLGAHGFDAALIGSLRNLYLTQYPLRFSDTGG